MVTFMLECANCPVPELDIVEEEKGDVYGELEEMPRLLIWERTAGKAASEVEKAEDVIVDAGWASSEDGVPNVRWPIRKVGSKGGARDESIDADVEVVGPDILERGDCWKVFDGYWIRAEVATEEPDPKLDPSCCLGWC